MAWKSLYDGKEDIQQLQSDLTNLKNDKNNPHEVTADQVGALNKSGDMIEGDLIIKDGFSILPQTALGASIGSLEKPIDHLFVGPNSLYIDGNKVIGSTETTLDITTTVDQHMSISTSGLGTTRLASGKEVILYSGNDLNLQALGDISTLSQGRIDFTTDASGQDINFETQGTFSRINFKSLNSVNFDSPSVIFTSTPKVGATNLQLTSDNISAYRIVEDENRRFVTDVEKTTWHDKYTQSEVDNKINQLTQNIDWKESVATFNDLATTHPNAEEGWVANVKDEDTTYRFNGTAWEDIGISAIPLATQTNDGKMSKEDKIRLDNMESNAINQDSGDARYLQLTGGTLTDNLIMTNNNAIRGKQTNGTHFTMLYTNMSDDVVLGDSRIAGRVKLYSPSTPLFFNGTNHYDLWHEGNLSKTEFAPASHVGASGSAHPVATITDAGFMGAADRTKLDGIEDNAINQATADGRYANKWDSIITGDGLLGGGQLNQTRTFSVDFDNNGTSTQASRADHLHDSRYAQLATPNTLVGGKLTIDNVTYNNHLTLKRTVDGIDYGVDITPSIDGTLQFLPLSGTNLFLFNRAIKTGQSLEVGTNIIVGGTVDGVDIANFKTSFDSHVGSRGTAHDLATTTEAGFMSAADKTKVNNIEAGAEVNQNAFGAVNVDGVNIFSEQKYDTLNLVSGTNITLTPNATTDTVTVNVSGIVAEADKLDGFHATTVQTASTIPVRDGDGKIAGVLHDSGDNLTGNLVMNNNVQLRGKKAVTGDVNLAKITSVDEVVLGDTSTNTKLQSNENVKVNINGTEYSMWHTGNFDPSNDATHNHDGLYVNVSGDAMDGQLVIKKGGSALRLRTDDAADHVFMEYYADSQNQNARSAWLGYGNSNNPTFTLYNQMAGGDINLATTSGKILANGSEVWSTANFNPGSKSDIDHLHDDRYLQLTGGTITGDVTLSNATMISMHLNATQLRGNASGASILSSGGADKAIYLRPHGSSSTAHQVVVNGNGGFTFNAHDVWHEGNFNPATKLNTNDTAVDANKLGGQLPSYYAVATHNHDAEYDARYVNTTGDTMTGTLNIDTNSGFAIGEVGGRRRIKSDGSLFWFLTDIDAYAPVKAADFVRSDGNNIWHAGNDGAGSGLDADLLDGKQAIDFANVSHTHPISEVTGLQAALDSKVDESGGAITGNLTVDGAILAGGQWKIYRSGGTLRIHDNTNLVDQLMFSTAETRFKARNVVIEESLSVTKDATFTGAINATGGVNGGHITASRSDWGAPLTVRQDGQGRFANFGTTANPTVVKIENDGSIHTAGNITLDGTVDGVDVAQLKTDFDTHTHPIATDTIDGLMSAGDHSKLFNIENNANNYVHPATHNATMIVEDATHRFVTDSEKATWNAKQNDLGYTPENIANKGVANGYASLDAGGKVPLSELPDTAKQQTYVVLDSTERNALTNLIEGERAFETSTGDSYIYDGTSWILMADADWQNVNLEWTNINGRPASSVTDLDDAVSKRHTHNNKTVLDGTEESFTTVLKTKLDGIQQGAINQTTGDTLYLGINAKAIDTDKLDGLDSVQFLRSDINQSMTGNLTVSGAVEASGQLKGDNLLLSYVHSPTKLDLQSPGNNYVIGTASTKMIYGQGGNDGWSLGHKFYEGTDLIAEIGLSGPGPLESKFYGGVEVVGNTVIGGDIVATGNIVGNTAHIGEVGHVGWAMFSHKDSATGTTFALGHNNAGAETILNAGDLINFRIGNSQKMKLASNGNLGINTTTPVEKLDVNGNIKASGDVIVGGVIKAGNNAYQVTFAPGESTQTITHNFGSANYMVTLGANSVARHPAWTNKQTNTVDIILDDSYTEEIIVDVIMMPY